MIIFNDKDYTNANEDEESKNDNDKTPEVKRFLEHDNRIQ